MGLIRVAAPRRLEAVEIAGLRELLGLVEVGVLGLQLRPGDLDRGDRLGAAHRASKAEHHCIHDALSAPTYCNGDCMSPIVSIVACARRFSRSASPNTISKWLVPGIGTKRVVQPRALAAAI